MATINGPPPANLLRAVERARRRRDNALTEYEQTLRDAVAAGHTLRAVAAAAGLSHGRIAQIVGKRD